jgi:hypothetical protein
MKNKKCLYCGKILSEKSKKKKRKYCSRYCSAKSHIGRKRSKETKNKISKKAKGNKKWLGKKHTDETKKKLSKSLKGKFKGEKNPMYGKKHTQEAKNKMSEKAKLRDPKESIKYLKEYISKNGNAMCGKRHKQEAKNKMSEKAKGNNRWIGKKHSDETKNKIRKSLSKNINIKYGGPNYNKKACEWFKIFDEQNNTKGRYALYGGGEYLIEELGYWVDYINHDLKLIIEWDEKRHYYANGDLKKKDIIRQNKIQKLYPEYSFLRIRE